MSIKERKIREVGNSITITLSKELLKNLGLVPGDTVLVDENKMMDAIVKKDSSISDEEVNFAILKGLSKYDETFKELVNR